MRPTLLLTSLYLTAFAIANDLVVLKNGDHFIGKISGLSEGLIEITSPHSENPLSLLSEHLHELSFEQSDAGDIPISHQVMTLRNGDSFPGEVTGLDEKTLKFDTWFAGELSIPRTQIESVYYEAAPQRLIYQGPKILTDWDQDDNWGMDGTAFQSNGRGSISRDLKLPEDFILQFRIEWKTSPNIRIHFCTEASVGANNKDGYYLSANSQGLQLQRVVTTEDEETARYLDLGRPNLRLDQLKERKATIEMRVSRSNRIIYLYLNGDFAGLYTDPGKAPAGSSVIFESQSSSRRQFKVSSIKLHEWDSKTRNLNREKHEKKSADTIATDEGDLYTGEIRQRILADERARYQVKIDLADQPVPIPEDRCSALYFKKVEIEQAPESTFEAALLNGGRLSLSDIELQEKDLTAQHPWLGELQLDRRILQELTRSQNATSK